MLTRTTLAVPVLAMPRLATRLLAVPGLVAPLRTVAGLPGTAAWTATVPGGRTSGTRRTPAATGTVGMRRFHWQRV